MRRRVGIDTGAAGGEDGAAVFGALGQHGICNAAAQAAHRGLCLQIAGVENNYMGHGCVLCLVFTVGLG